MTLLPTDSSPPAAASALTQVHQEEPLEPPRAAPGVTGNGTYIPWAPIPAEWSPEQLAGADALNLGTVAASTAAEALVDALAGMVAVDEALAGKRGNQRRGTGLARLRRAVEGIVGSLLWSWGRSTPRLAFHSFHAAAFSGGLVGHRQFIAAIASLTRLGLVGQRAGIRYAAYFFEHEDGPVYDGRAARFWPTSKLLAQAVAHGVFAEGIRADFRLTYPTKPPRIAEFDLVALKPIKRQKRDREGPPLMERIPLGDPARGRLREPVRAMNALAERHAVQGCTPPRWTRQFRGNLALYGRWIATGGGNYQSIPKADRAAIRIDGEAVAEVDVRASHLTIMHGLLDLPAPEGDPYTVGEAGPCLRGAVKAWVTATLGKGGPVKRWSKHSLADRPGLADFPADRLGDLVCGRYPFLCRPALEVAGVAGLDTLGHLGTPQRLLTFRLMALEAEALTVALTTLWGQGTLALPLHDALIVPAPAVAEARAAMTDAFRTRLGVVPTLTVSGAAEPAA